MGFSSKAKEKLETNPAQFVELEIKEFVRTSPDNRLSFINDYIMWEEPLISFADGDDPIFIEYKTIIATEHLTPREALAKAYDKSPEDMPARLSVISWILPAVEETRKSNRAEALIAALTSIMDLTPLTDNELSGISLPCLVFAGELDPRQTGAKESVNHMPQARFVSLLGLDHEVLLRSDLVLPHVKEFLAQVR